MSRVTGLKNRGVAVWFADFFNVLFLNKAAVDQHLLGCLLITLFVLIDHGRHLSLITTRVVNVDAGDDLGL